MPSPSPVTQAPQTAEEHATSARLVLFLTVFIDLLGFGIVIPFLPMFARHLRVGGAGVGALLAIYSLMQFFFSPMLGRLSDRIGRRPVIMLGLFGSSLGYLIYGFADSFATLLLSRAVHGACAATVSTAQAYVADTTTESDRAHGMGMIGAAFGLGFVLGPALGGLLGRESLRVPVFFASALTLANLVFAALKLKESRRPADAARADPARELLGVFSGTPARLRRHRVTARLFLVGFLLTLAMAALETSFSLTIPAVYGYGAMGIGGLLAFAGIIQAFTQGYLIKRTVGLLGESRLLRMGVVLFALGLAPVGSLPARTALFVMLALVAIGYGFATTSVATLISRGTVADLQGEALGINQSAQSMARILGPLGAGLAYQLLGPTAPFVGGAGVALVALAMTRATGK